MALPSDTDYVAAIQNPANCFADPDLRTGTVELMGPALPIPKARSGNFATVYRLTGQSASWAVRCFTRHVHPDQRLRYDEISKALAVAKIPQAVGFRYLEQGIRVGATWHPIVKMEWVQGEPLDVYIARHLHDQRSLLSLAKAWVEMSALLARHGLAHGDLQHGNVLVVGGALKLVDYDGMFVPALAGYASHESGHRNYQHPGRTTDTFGASLDHFSEWVIFVSLLALASSPRLWSTYKGGDDCLLLRRADFDDPDGSALLTELGAVGDSRSRAAAALFRTLVQLPPDQIPPLDSSLLAAPPSAQVPTAGRLPTWVAGHIQSPGQPSEAIGEAPVGVASWILDHLDADTRLLRWDPPVRLERALLLSTLAALIVAWVAMPSTARQLLAILSAATPIVHLTAWRIRHLRSDAYHQFSRVSAMSARAIREAKAAEQGTRLPISKLAEVTKFHATAVQQLARERQDIEAAHQSALALLRTRLQQVVAEVAARRKDLDLRESSERQAVLSRFGSSITLVQGKVAVLVRQESIAVHDELARLEREAVERALKAESVLNVPVNRDGPLHILYSAGIKTLFEAESGRVLAVFGVGKKTNDAVQHRRALVATKARANAPKALEPGRDAQVRASFVAQRLPIEQELRRLEAARDQGFLRVKSIFDKERTEASFALSQAQQAFAAAEQHALATYAATLGDHNRRLARAESDRTHQVMHAEEVLATRRKECCSAEFVKQRALRDLERARGMSFRAYVKRILGAA